MRSRGFGNGRKPQATFARLVMQCRTDGSAFWNSKCRVAQSDPLTARANAIRIPAANYYPNAAFRIQEYSKPSANCWPRVGLKLPRDGENVMRLPLDSNAELWLGRGRKG